jgi:hypothetical protein
MNAVKPIMVAKITHPYNPNLISSQPGPNTSEWFLLFFTGHLKKIKTDMKVLVIGANGQIGTHLVELLKEHGLDEHIDKANLESELERIKQVFEPIETFRHKVAAHTSYSYPKKDDGLLQLNSLLNLTPRPGSEVLGGKSFMGGHNGDIPLVTILTYEADTESYFGEWVELYTKVLTPLQKKFTGAKGHINLDN